MLWKAAITGGPTRFFEWGVGQSRDSIRYLTYFGLWVWDTIIHQSAMTRIAANQIVMHCILLNDFLVD